MAEPWRLYYKDGSTAHSDDVAPESAPTHDIISIVFNDSKYGRLAIRKSEFYLWEGSVWLPVDLFGMMDWMRVLGHLTRSGGNWIIAGQVVDPENVVIELLAIGIVKTGGIMAPAAEQVMMEKARTDPGFHRISANHRPDVNRHYQAPRLFLSREEEEEAAIIGTPPFIPHETHG